MSKTESKTLTTSKGKTMHLFPRVPLAQYRFIVDAAKDIAALKDSLRKQGADRAIGFRYDLQRMQVVQHKIECFEQVRREKQAGAAVLYRKALQSMIVAANEVLAENGRAELLDGSDTKVAATA
jgi:hypothetical protein